MILFYGRGVSTGSGGIVIQVIKKRWPYDPFNMVIIYPAFRQVLFY